MFDVVPIGAVVVAACAVLAVAPLRRPRSAGTVSWILGNFANELPFVFFVVVVVPTLVPLIGEDLSARDQVTVVLMAVVVVALVIVVSRALGTRAAAEAAFRDALGGGWRAEVPSGDSLALDRRRRWARILFVPFPLRPRSVVRTADVAYGPRGSEQFLDVYRHRSEPPSAPTLIHLHGGRFRWGRKSREARSLLFRLAEQGWTCISANYHLSPTPAEGFPTHLIDVKRILAWCRGEGRLHGVDPDAIVLSGSSAGAHLTVMAALTANDPMFQPGFEDVDTSFAAGVCLGGYYGGLDGDDGSPTSPLANRGPVPPFFVVHGLNDTVTSPEGARGLVRHLRAQPGPLVLHAELPGGQHGFGLFGSLRFEAVVDGIEAFVDWVGCRPAGVGLT